MNDYLNKPISAYILLGGNIGNRLAYLQKACRLIELHCGTIVQRSSVYETAAWGNTHQQSFYNACIGVTTNLLPQTLLQTLLQIEQQMGRIRTEKYGPRTIDIDILLLNNLIVETADLVVPHPHLPNRLFALTPLAEIAAQVLHPTSGKTIAQLLTSCTDKGAVTRITSL